MLKITSAAADPAPEDRRGRGGHGADPLLRGLVRDLVPLLEAAGHRAPELPPRAAVERPGPGSARG